MSENNIHHHHHKHRRTDWATDFKHKSLNAIKRRKVIEKWLFLALCLIAFIMFVAVIITYQLD